MTRLLPNERFVYFGDNKNAPYGTRPEEEILDLSKRCVDFLISKNAKAIVIACNTATSAAAACFRNNMDIPIIGMEPALKPASLMRKNGKIAVLATNATLRQNKFRLLMQKYGEHAFPLPAPGLVEFVERGELDGKALEAYLEGLFSPYRDIPIDGVVLGCTHYVFLKHMISKSVPGAFLVDGNEGTARQLANVLNQRGLLRTSGEGSVSFFSSADDEKIVRFMRRLYETEIE